MITGLLLSAVAIVVLIVVPCLVFVVLWEEDR